MAAARTVLPGSTYPELPAAATYVGRYAAATVDVTVVLRPQRPLDGEAIVLAAPAERAAAAARYRAGDGAVAEVAAFAAERGLALLAADPLRRTVELRATAAAMERAFGVGLLEYRTDAAPFLVQRGAVELPSTLAGHVVAVLGLDGRPVLRPHAAAAALPKLRRYPREVADLYRFPPGDGAGTAVALLEFGGNYSADDLAAYCRAAGTPLPHVVEHAVCGYAGDRYDSGSGSMEVMLDIEVLGNIVPAARIDVYFASNDHRGLYQALSQAVHGPGTTAVSISWGHCEERFSEQVMSAVELLAQQAALLDVVIFAACGDMGTATDVRRLDGRRRVVFPASAPSIVACGGTSLSCAGGRITGETVWNDHAGATGGGISDFFGVPARQHGLSAEGDVALTRRGVPDIAGAADPETGYLVRWAGSDGCVAGTSAVAPLWSALVARIAARAGRNIGCFLPLLYRNPSACNDIVSGSNHWRSVPGFAAKPGWDACTGLGSPDGQRIAELFAAARPARCDEFAEMSRADARSGAASQPPSQT